MTNETETTLPVLSTDEFFPPKMSVRLLFDGQLGFIDRYECTVSESPLVIGRAVEEDGIKVQDPSASRQHARILHPDQGEGQYIIEDMSSNGSFVNGKRISSQVLCDGDIVRVGNSLLLIRFRSDLEQDSPLPELVGDSPSMGLLRRDISMVGPSDATVLVFGETGTGKELVARALHKCSGRTGPFVPVNCAAIPATLAESQLFGHIAGSFTGAKENRAGFFRQAHTGTLFLDEVGELPLEVQPKLLRVLEDHAVIPVGSVTPIPLHIRIIAATNRDLEAAIDQQIFRADLYARLAEFVMHTPPLAKRREDILPLFRLKFGSDTPELAPDLVEMLLLHPWRYNVRELFKLATTLKVQARHTERLEISHVHHQLGSSGMSQADHSTPVSTDENEASIPSLPPEPLPPPVPGRAKVPGRDQIEQGLTEAAGNVCKLSRILGKSRRQTYRYLEMYEIDPNKYR